MRAALWSLLALPLCAQANHAKAPTDASTALKAPLAFFSQKFPYRWDQLLPLKVEVDGIRVHSIFFNRREVARGPLKGLEFGTRAQVEVTNATSKPRNVGFAVAVFDQDQRLLGVASGGTRWFSLRPGVTDTFDLNFAQVLERLPLGETFALTLELGE